ncbi:MAG: hypothetical protein ACFFCQ_18175, partial [Promethearchaeota archaeon]
QYQKAIEISDNIISSLSENRYPSTSEKIENLLEELSLLAPLELQEKLRILNTIQDEKVFDKEKIHYFIREILLAPPSMRYPLCPLNYIIHSDENYD